MRLTEVLRPHLPHRERGGVVALVGAGGKTSALFCLGDELAAEGQDVVMTTTTHIFDPRREQGRPFDRVVLVPRCAEPPGPEEADLECLGEVPRPQGQGRRVVLAAAEVPALGKLRGVDAAWIGRLAETTAVILVEADGARSLPLKAPDRHEPVIPEATDVVLGLVGLDALDQPMGEGIVHRPEAFAQVTGCASGEPIHLRHLAALARSPQGLFKGAPARARRVLVLNKADRCPLPPAELLRELCAWPMPGITLVLVCALQDLDPGKRVLAQMHPNAVQDEEACPPCR